MSLNEIRSKNLFEKAQKMIPGGVNSPVRAFRSVGGTPLFMKQGKGSRITDVDDNTFIDYCCSWGPLISGHAHPAIIEKIVETAANGTSFGTPNPHEVEIASFITEKLPHVEMIRFVNSGTEAVMSAIRVARGFTGRDKIIKFDGCYHGAVDSLLVNAGSGLVTFGISSTPGVPQKLAEETLVLPLDREDLVEELLAKYPDSVAAIILEPIPANNGLLLQRKEFLQKLRELATKYGVVLIFDEVISGFRVALGGATEVYGVQPDMVTFGKIIGGGFPVGAYGGKKEIMNCIAPVGKIYQAGTLSGNPVAMAAGFAQLQLLSQPGFYDNLEKSGKQFSDGLSEIISRRSLPVTAYRIGSIIWTYFGKAEIMRAAHHIDGATMDHYKKFFRYCLEHGIYIAPSGYEVGFLSSAHSPEDIAETLQVIDEAMAVTF
ncbi:MAG: glutamate-1-semialdehyde 2,1-aminomutase [Bacteroidetes bacterium]|nr:glutamate-1-semialdehyde 2,1-aminomutase [Bacteroidota bacterium]